MESRPLPREGKKPTTAAYVDSIGAVLTEAHRAAGAAFTSYMQSIDRRHTSHVQEANGLCMVVGKDLNLRLRNALRMLGALKDKRDGSWIVSDFEKHAKSNNSVACRHVCDAACAILVKKIPGEGTFVVVASVPKNLEQAPIGGRSP